ncbi:Lrp/AsnC family transcriptional regulator [Celeribacter indicus]|uniref:AsnC family transcriptional regulator n=1 Tax=Celeribacter indicus TaxID=1208324 RepID=A0A0B5DUK4_9RHOB|nr:Lrp/AsnC family transcriptional regulator [Celeribacter indicus]AJE47108.1 AsnC family transcriptional regulator [Celeribacter indicus]SDW90650.1 transcriptional regulator, AsnC family [Celeribacter indicus]
MPTRTLDRLDIAILEALQENARMPLSEVGRRIGLSQPATSERVRRLEDRGIITGYGVRVDPAALGLGMTAIIRLRTTHEHIRPALRAFAGMPHVIEVHRLTGEDCFLLKVLVPTPAQLETLVDTVARFGAVTTSLVLRSEPVKPLGKALLS